MTNTYSSSNSISLQILETAASAAELRAAVPPEAKSGPVPLKQAATSLPVLVGDVRRGHRCEAVAWLVLAGSALILLALSLWL
jgi:hypothetical protein